MKKNKFKKFKEKKVTSVFLWKVIVSVLFVSLFIFSLYKYFYTSSLFLIKNVYSNEKIIIEDLKKNIKKESLLTLDTNALHRKLLNRYPEYSQITILKIFPSSLKIEVKKREPFSQWKNKKFYLLDREGVAISEGRNTPFPNLILIEIDDYKYSLKKGSKIKDERLVKAFSLIDELKKRKFFDSFSITLINPTNLQSLYFVLNGIKIIVGISEFERKIYLLENLLKRKLKDKLHTVKYIDLRYKKIYLGFKR
jgi:cell division septal protein FtsQ